MLVSGTVPTGSGSAVCGQQPAQISYPAPGKIEPPLQGCVAQAWAQQSSRTPAQQAVDSGLINFRACLSARAVSRACDVRWLTVPRESVAGNMAIA